MTTKQERLQKLVDAVHEKLGDGSSFIVGSNEVHRKVEAIPSGVLPLDVALGIGGYPKGRIVEIFGPESSGKTTLALHAIASAQEAGGIAAFIDAEHALDPFYAEALGVDLGAMALTQPDCGEDGLEAAATYISAGAQIVVVDSVAALTPRAEIEGDMGQKHMGLQARLMSQALRKLASVVSTHKAVLIFINQIRHKIGVFYGSPETTTGGNSLKFYASARLDIRRIKTLKHKVNGVEQPYGSRTRVKVVKNKVAPPFQECEFEIWYGRGAVKSVAILEAAINAGIVAQSGAWFSYKGEKLGQGKRRCVDALEEDPKKLNDIEAEVISKGVIQ
jgi:recombination protein RecA